MALLHYENLNLHRPEIVLRQVDHGLRDVAGYLSRSIDFLKSHAVRRASWRALKRAELTDLSSEERATGVWVELDDPQGARNDGGDALAAFFDDDVHIVYDRVDRPDGRVPRAPASRRSRPRPPRTCSLGRSRCSPEAPIPARPPARPTTP